MRTEGDRIESDYREIQYHQFTQGPALRAALGVAAVLSWIVALPLALLARTSDVLFRTFSEMLAVVPYVIGTVVRGEFYRFALTECGRNVHVGFGTVFIYADVRIGDNVLIGMHNTIHHCDFGSYVLVADGCRFLSGSRYHHFDRTDVPMALQGGAVRRITIADDCWIGAQAIVMDDVDVGSVVGAGAVVTKPVEPWTVVAGNPAHAVRSRVDRSGT